MSYIDLYLLPVREDKLDAYREQATAFGRVAREHGALSYREFRGDDPDGTFEAADGRLMTAAVVEFDSREHRDDVMATVMDDPRVTAMLGGEQLADMGAMRYGGFSPLVSV